MSTNDRLDAVVDVRKNGKRGHGIVTTKAAGRVVSVESIDLSSPEARAAAAERIGTAMPGLDAADTHQALLDAAAEVVEPERSQATILANIAIAEYELWHTSGQKCFTTIQADDGHRENHLVGSQTLNHWLRRLCYTRFKSVIASEALNGATSMMAAHALIDGPEHPTYVRVGGVDGKILVDLGDPRWRVIEIDACGWRIVENPDVRFHRAPGMHELPEPAVSNSADLGLLWRFLNVSPDDRVLLLAWLVCALRDTGPYPVLALHGEQGTAKSSAARVLRRLVDPSLADVTHEPWGNRELCIAANNSWVCAFDNLSSMPPWFSDALCCLSTGGGMRVRTLYSDTDETIFNAMRPTIIAGIENVVTRGDLADRCYTVELQPIADTARRTESSFWREFNEARPAILAALFNAVSTAIRRLPTIQLDRLPRLADAAVWVEAAAPALGIEPWAFVRRFASVQRESDETVVESSLIGPGLLALASGQDEYCRPGWEGTATQLLAALVALTTDVVRRSREWPTSPRALSGKLRTLATSLRRMGVEVDFGGNGRGADRSRWIRLSRSSAPRRDPTTPSATLSPTPSVEFLADGRERSTDDSGTIGERSKDLASSVDHQAEGTVGTVGTVVSDADDVEVFQ